MEILPGIHELHGRVVNCHLVRDDDGIILIDTGLPGNSSKIIKYVENNMNHRPQEIKTIVITHQHMDHVGSLSKMKDKTGATIAIHPADADYIRGNTDHTGPALSNAMVKLIQFLYRTKPVEPDILVEDGDLIGDYQVIHTPGHTPGSICLYNPKNKVIFVGDNLQYKDGKLLSPGERLLPEPEKYKKSMQKLLNYDIEAIFTGHTAPVTSDAGKLLKDFVEELST
ncbi:MAG: MBL fold metallo-hydrolase [Methanobacteriaceae archaeon]